MASLDNQLCFLLYVSSKEIIKRYTIELKPYNLTYTGFITMLAIEDDEQITVKELGHRLYLDSGTLTPLLKKLEEKGYISRKRSAIDEREMNVSLTELGRQVRQELPCISDKIAVDMKLTREQYEQVKGTLTAFIKNT